MGASEKKPPFEGLLRENAGATDINLTEEEVKRLDDPLDHMEISEVYGGSKIVQR